MSDPLAVIQRIRASRPAPKPMLSPATQPGRQPGEPGRELDERCELCAAPIAAAHDHVVDVAARRLLCACPACRLLFSSAGAGGGHFRAVPDRFVELDDLHLDRAQWDALQIPVGVAFFFWSSAQDGVAALYPGPAGATESLLALEAWEDVVASNPVVAGLAPDVEAFLVRAERRVPGLRGYIVPIDACYELVGLLRRCWRGFDGGAESRQALDAFFGRVEARAR